MAIDFMTGPAPPLGVITPDCWIETDFAPWQSTDAYFGHGMASQPQRI
jgi:hypothetical protein